MRWFSFLILVFLLIFVSPGMHSTAWAQDDSSSEQLPADSPESSGTTSEGGDSEGKNVIEFKNVFENQKVSEEGCEPETPAESEEQANSEETPVVEGETFSVCPDCGYRSDEGGSCPACNISLVAEKPASSEKSEEKPRVRRRRV